jgi:hypothetical protein
VVVIFIELWDLMVRENSVVAETEVDRPCVGMGGGRDGESGKIEIG